MATATRIGIIGDFNRDNAIHIATNDGIQHAAEALNKSFESVWLPTDELWQYGTSKAYCAALAALIKALKEP
ncbi:MAG TPA: hypothetical protein VK604_08730 [Bryobacteraceae bacterium]|nr:hypothetical protein [Bryobacteraceae bacterium]